MSRPLPARPNLDHLKAQAKDLLDAHRRREPEAFARIRAHVPAFAAMSDDALARAGFALHDAQSAIAREYGFASWAELRDKLAAMVEPPAAPADVDAARLATAQRFVAAAGLPAEVVDSVREALARRGAAAGVPTPERVPVLPLRNAVAFPGGVIPLDIQRPTTLRAVDAARAHTPALLAIFAQHAAETEQPSAAELHTTGCLCSVLHHVARDAGPASIIIEGVRWIRLEALEQTEPYYLARVSDVALDPAGDDQRDQLAALAHRLRDTARKVAGRMVIGRDQALAVIDQTDDAGRLADLVMSSFPHTVADAASYAAESQRVRRLERALAVLDAELAKPAASAT